MKLPGTPTVVQLHRPVQLLLVIDQMPTHVCRHVPHTLPPAPLEDDPELPDDPLETLLDPPLVEEVPEVLDALEFELPPLVLDWLLPLEPELCELVLD